MAIIIICLFLTAIAACAFLPKTWHRVAMLIVMGFITYNVCSAMVAAYRKMSVGAFWSRHAAPAKQLLSAIRYDLNAGNTNAAIHKLDVALEDWSSLSLHRTNVTVETINKKLGICEHPAGP